MSPRTSLSYCLSVLSDFLPEDLPSLTPDLPTELILQALYATGTASIRRRRLPAEQVVWLVLGMALFRHLSIVQIVDQLGLALPKGRSAIVPAAIHRAYPTRRKIARTSAAPIRTADPAAIPCCAW